MATYDQQPDGAAPRSAVDPSLVTTAHVIYGLHTLSILIGLTSAATIVGAFLFGIPSIVAVIFNYARQREVRGTFLESHFRWQIRTFWLAALWATVGVVLWIMLAIVLIGFLIGPAILIITGLWVIYRVARGWLALRDGQPVASGL